jgi:outer membrane protein assembly factor BamA
LIPRALVCIIGFLLTVNCYAQFAFVNEITLSGNTQTKDFVILREMVVKRDSIYSSSSKGNFDELVELSENRIRNLNLFNTVVLSIVDDSTKNDIRFISLNITVVEKWFFWPIPFVEFSDRNVNVWKDLDFDPNRTNYGLYGFVYNLFGRNHRLKTNLKTGYNKELGLEYRIPFISQNSNWGLNAMANYKSQNEVWFQTKNDSLQFFKNGKKNLIQTRNARLELTKRIRPIVKLFLGAELGSGELDSSVSTSDYFLNGLDNQSSYGVDIKAEIDTRNNIYYPISGVFYQTKVAWQQWTNTSTVSNVKFQLKLQQFYQLSNRWYTVMSGYGQYNTQEVLPYSLRKMFGYDEIIRGYENYVIDGNLGWKYNAAIRYHLLDKSEMKLKFIPIKNYKVLPFNIYVEAYTDGGSVYYSNLDSSNMLVNKYLYSGGLGLNMLFYNDRLLRLEYSLNSMQEGGFFVHFKKAI